MQNEIEFGKRYVVVSKTSTHRGMIVTAIEKCKGHSFDDIIIVKPDDDRAFRITVGTDRNPTLRPATIEDEVRHLRFDLIMNFCRLVLFGFTQEEAFERTKSVEIKPASTSIVRDTMVGAKQKSPLCSIAGGCQICDSQSNAYCMERMFEARSTRDEL